MKTRLDKTNLLCKRQLISRKDSTVAGQRFRPVNKLGVSFATLRLCVQPLKVRCRQCIAPILLVLAIFFAPIITADAQMLHPSIDRDDEPFCYFSKPTDVIGVMDGKEGTLVTPEGYLCTGFGELMFFTGNLLEPVRQRVKTLLQGYLPVVQYQFEKENVRYHLTLFTATLDANPESPLINFIRVKIRNQSSQPRMAYFGVGTRYQNDANTDWELATIVLRTRYRQRFLGSMSKPVWFSIPTGSTLSPEMHFCATVW